MARLKPGGLTNSKQVLEGWKKLSKRQEKDVMKVIENKNGLWLQVSSVSKETIKCSLNRQGVDYQKKKWVK